MAELPAVRKSLRLSWSEAISGAELYDCKDVETFATDWHLHEGWQLIAVTKGGSWLGLARCLIDPLADAASSRPSNRVGDHRHT